VFEVDLRPGDAIVEAPLTGARQELRAFGISESELFGQAFPGFRQRALLPISSEAQEGQHQ
jgi:hypothetical protein